MTSRRGVVAALAAALIAFGLALAPPAAAQQGHMRRAAGLLQQAKEVVESASFSSDKRKEEALHAIQRALVQTRKGIEAGLEDEEEDED